MCAYPSLLRNFFSVHLIPFVAQVRVNLLPSELNFLTQIGSHRTSKKRKNEKNRKINIRFSVELGTNFLKKKKRNSIIYDFITNQHQINIVQFVFLFHFSGWVNLIKQREKKCPVFRLVHMASFIDDLFCTSSSSTSHWCRHFYDFTTIWFPSKSSMCARCTALATIAYAHTHNNLYFRCSSRTRKRLQYIFFHLFLFSVRFHENSEHFVFIASAFSHCAMQWKRKTHREMQRTKKAHTVFCPFVS